MLYNLQTRVECAFLFFLTRVSAIVQNVLAVCNIFAHFIVRAVPRFLYEPTLKLGLFNSQYTWDNLTLTHFSDVAYS